MSDLREKITNEIETAYPEGWGHDDVADRIIALVVKERDAQVARMQEVIRRWALESYTEDTFPGWWMLEEMNGLKPGDLTPAGLADTGKEQGE